MFKGKSEFTIVESIPYKFHWLIFDLNRGSAVASKDFRKAVAHAIDKQEFLDRFGYGFGNTCRQGGIAKTHPYFNGNVIEYEYDQAKAKVILDDLGYKDIDGDGFRENPDGTPMVLSMLVDAKAARLAELVAFKMEEVGVRVDIETVDSMALMKHFRQGAKGYDMYFNWGGHLWLARDPDFLRRNFHPEAHARVLSFHAVGFNNEEFNELATEQLRTLDDTKRRQLLDRMQEIVADELPILYIYAKNHYFVFNNTVHDGWMHPYNHGRYDFSKLSYLREHSEHEPVTIK
jgi:peptide/nickel transport system substrate-binding protein